MPRTTLWNSSSGFLLTTTELPGGSLVTLNQARSDRILWIIGATDDDGGAIPGLVLAPDPAVWWPQVSKRFDTVAPDPSFVNLSFEDVPVLAIGFETARIPYVLRLAADNPSREVPWRAGTSVRSATRSDLLRLLVPVARLPSVSVLSGTLTVESRREVGGITHHWRGDIDVYADCPGPVTFPDHRCAAVVEFGGESLVLRAEPAVYGHPQRSLARSFDGQILLEGSTPFQIMVEGQSQFDEIPVAAGSRGDLTVVLESAGLDRGTVYVGADLLPIADDSAAAAWQVEPPSGASTGEQQ